MLGLKRPEKPEMEAYIFQPLNSAFADIYTSEKYKLTSSEKLRRDNPEAVAHTLAWGRAIGVFEDFCNGMPSPGDKLKKNEVLQFIEAREGKEDFKAHLKNFIRYKKIEGSEIERARCEALNIDARGR